MAKTKKRNKQHKFVQKDQQHNQSQARSESFDICNFAYFFYDQYPDSIVKVVVAVCSGGPSSSGGLLRGRLSASPGCDARGR